jgi:hypothetical protein
MSELRIKIANYPSVAAVYDRRTDRSVKDRDGSVIDRRSRMHEVFETISEHPEDATQALEMIWEHPEEAA